MNTTTEPKRPDTLDSIWDKGRQYGLLQASIHVLTCGRFDANTARALSDEIVALPDDSAMTALTQETP